MNTKVEEALALLDAEVAGCGRLEPEDCDNCARIKKARTTIAAHIAQQDATIARLEQALRLFTGSAYPVEESINPRGHNWSESYLDAELVFAATLNQEQGK